MGSSATARLATNTMIPTKHDVKVRVFIITLLIDYAAPAIGIDFKVPKGVRIDSFSIKSVSECSLGVGADLHAVGTGSA